MIKCRLFPVPAEAPRRWLGVGLGFTALVALLGLAGCGGGDSSSSEPGVTPSKDAGKDSAPGDAQPDVLATPDAEAGTDAQPEGGDSGQEAGEGGCVPGSAELCNGVDDNCDGNIDEGDPEGGVACDTGEPGACSDGIQHCTGGALVCEGQTQPGDKAEICNGVDDDCNGSVDDGNPGGGAACQTGLDGICATGVEQCVQGVVSCIPDHGPGEVNEICNHLDDDCDGFIDEGVPTQSYYTDDDGDQYGTTASVVDCAPPAGYVAASGDCNDNNPNIHPNAVEICNDSDDNCNGFTDEGVQKPTFYKDNDGDQWGGTTTVLACTAPAGYVADSGDCNDFNNQIYPGAPEVCNDLDDDCNGPIDDGLPQLTMYKDGDGDTFAPPNAASQVKCNVPVGWALEQDVDGDGTPDWDCTDSDTTVYPGAPTVCGDNKDNNCDGYVDRLCYTNCSGTWPFLFTNTAGITSVRPADLNGDGNYEVIVQDSFGFALLNKDGAALYNYSAPVHNYSRSTAILADIDGYDQHGAGIQTLEVLTGNGSHPSFYKLEANSSVTVYTSAEGVYDASRFMARDIDGDGTPEFFTTSWCNGAQGTRVFRFNRTAGTIDHVVDVADPDNTCEYTDGRVLTDLDGDGTMELVFGNGYPYATAPSGWGGNVYAFAFSDLTTLAHQPFCASGTCFDTAIAPLFGGGVGDLFRFGGELRTRATYFETNIDSANNVSQAHSWTFDLAGQVIDGPTAANTTYLGVTDVDRDGTPEDFSDTAYTGLFDVNNDGYPDRVYASGVELRIALWDPSTSAFVENVGSRSPIAASNVVLRGAWDIDADGALEILASDTTGHVYCKSLGQDTWNKASSLPPHFPQYLRTYQWDNFEPNEGGDVNGDGMPDEIVRVPSALTAKGDFYGYLSSATDVDYYLVDAAWGGNICITAPQGYSYSLKVFSFFDRWDNTTHAPGADGAVDGLIWENTGAGTTKCFAGSNVVPYRYGEYRFIIGIENQGGSFTPYWPYWINAAK